MASVRRVVTGHDRDGKSTVVDDGYVDGELTAQSSTTRFHLLWASDETPHFPDNGQEPVVCAAGVAPVGGFRFWQLSFPPGVGSGEMHTTASVDFVMVLSGEIELLLNDDSAVRLKAGETLVQNGTAHSWRNPGDSDAVLIVVMCGAHHDGSGLSS